jgi:Restriction endonuclease
MEATKTQHRYWAIRTDKDNKALLLGELRNGRLRQGWGYEPTQDLRLIQAEISKGGNWWERLSSAQREVLPQLRMLATSQDSIQVGDWAVVPNLPEHGEFLVAEVAGSYQYDPLVLSTDRDVNELGRDYGHILPVRLLTDRGINKYAAEVDARIRSTLKTPMRMWNVDYCGESLEMLLESYKAGTDVTTPKSGEARLAKAWETALSHAVSALRERLGPELDSRFQAAEWEEPIKMVLQRLYPEADVRWVAGPRESGADVIVQIPNHFGGLPWLIVVQVKNYQGEIGPAVLTQLRNAHGRYGTEGKLLCLVVMTTAEKASAGWRNAADELSQELSVPIEMVLRERMMKILSEGLMTSQRSNGGET